VSLGAAVKIQVSAKGARMQWQKRVGESEFTDIPGATGQVLGFNDVTVEQEGEYRFVVSSSTGEPVISQIATVAVDPTFIKITGQPIVEDVEPSQSAVWFDYDADGWVDLFVANHHWNVETGSQPPSSLYHNQRDGTFAKLRNALTPDLRGLYSVVCADYDNDGRTDVFLGQFHGGRTDGRVFLNGDDGTFHAVPLNLGDACDAAARDLDGDGWVDLALSTYNATRVYRNLGNGQFDLIATAQLGALGNVPSASASFADFDNDGRPDLHTPREGDPGKLLRNVGGFAFEAIQAGSLPGTINTVASAWGDYDNDGFFDLLTVSSAWGGGHPSRLHRNVPHPTDPSRRIFEDVTASSGLLQLPGDVWGPAWGDYNNDGHLDLFIPHPQANNSLLVNQGDGTFLSVDVGSPVRDGAETFCAVWGDYDNDGFLDLFLTCGEVVPRHNLLYRNNLQSTGNQNHWLKVQLDGRASNRSGIGAVLRLQATIAGRDMSQTRQIAANGNFGSGTELLAHFGLGDATKVDTLRIEWPSGIVQELNDVEVDQMLQVVETQGLILPDPLSIQTFELDATGVFHATVNCSVDGAVCVLESSSDLERWTKVRVGTSSGGTVKLTDARAGDSPGKFYRVLVP
jgi:enediyne biosynthesis protein E4